MDEKRAKEIEAAITWDELRTHTLMNYVDELIEGWREEFATRNRLATKLVEYGCPACISAGMPNPSWCSLDKEKAGREIYTKPYNHCKGNSKVCWIKVGKGEK